MTSRGKNKKPTKAAQKAADEKARKAQEDEAQRAREALEHQEAFVVPAVRELQARSECVGTVYLLHPQDGEQVNRRVPVPQSARNEPDEAESSRAVSGKPIHSPRSSGDRPPKSAKLDNSKDSEESDDRSSDTANRFGAIIVPRRSRTRVGPPASSLPASAPRARHVPPPAGENSSSGASSLPPLGGSMAPPPVPQRALSESQHASSARSGPITQLSSQEWAELGVQAGSLCDEIDEYQRKYF
ncbi:hypothetical protein QCA50_016997 [Cerrena zonata]|uniref:Uncharacterized protein n=1 Tax=Cerrena zonata TaxID=2478898 RepID=A0AAW0FGZ2_9APHY